MEEICVGNGISFNGRIINGNEFQLYSGVHRSVIDNTLNIDLNIPSTCVINNSEYTITKIRMYAFFNCSITSITLPPTINVVEGGFAESSRKLISADLSMTKIKILSWCTFFLAVKLQTVLLPETVTEIGNKAFALCISLETIVLPPKLSYIYNDSFAETKSDNILWIK